MNLVIIKNNTEFSRFDIAVRVIVLLIFLAASLLLLYIPPDRLSIISCAFKEFTGHSCPTCGLTRSLHYLLNFDMVSSLYFHPMGVVLFTSLLFLSVKFGYELFARKTVVINSSYISKRVVLFSITIFWSMFWIIRLITE